MARVHIYMHKLLWYGSPTSQAIQGSKQIINPVFFPWEVESDS